LIESIRNNISLLKMGDVVLM